MNNTTPIRTAAVLTTTGLPTLKRDPILAPGIVGLFDFGSAYVRQGKTAFAANDEFLNMVDGGQPAIAVSTIPGVSGNGLVFDATDKSIRLPGDWLWPADQQRWAVCAWAKVDPTGYPANGGVGVIGDNGDANQYWLGGLADGSGGLTALNANLGSIIYAGPSEGVHQYVLLWESVNGGTQRRITVYNNGSVTQQATVGGGSMTAPTTDIAKIGQGAGGLSSGFKGSFYRTYAVDLDVYSGTLENLIVDDYHNNLSRFS